MFNFPIIYSRDYPYPTTYSRVPYQRLVDLLIAGIYCCSVVQSPSPVWLFVTPWTAAHQASLSFTISQSLLQLMSVDESKVPSNHLILCHPLLLLPSIFSSIRVFSKESVLLIRSASGSVLPMNSQDWSPLGWTCLISLRSKGLSRVFSNTTVPKNQFGAQLSL